jgi:hypothetical protein
MRRRRRTMKTKTDIPYHCTTGLKTVIPRGTEVIPATNLPQKDLYWAEPWPGQTEREESHGRVYGYCLTLDEVNGTQ